MLNVGRWGFGSSQQARFVPKNCGLERRLREFGGMKWPYDHTYYKENEFWELFDRQWYDGLRRKYNAEPLPSIWHKVKVDSNAQRQAVDRSWGTWAIQFWPLGKILGIRKAIESGEYPVARNSTWKTRDDEGKRRYSHGVNLVFNMPQYAPCSQVWSTESLILGKCSVLRKKREKLERFFAKRLRSHQILVPHNFPA